MAFMNVFLNDKYLNEKKIFDTYILRFKCSLAGTIYILYTERLEHVFDMK